MTQTHQIFMSLNTRAGSLVDLFKHFRISTASSRRDIYGQLQYTAMIRLA